MADSSDVEPDKVNDSINFPLNLKATNRVNYIAKACGKISPLNSSDVKSTVYSLIRTLS